MLSKKYRVNNLQRDIEPHEIFLDALANKREEELGISEKKLEVPLSEKITKFIFGIFIFLILIFSARTFYFQVFQGKKFAILSEENRTRISLITPERGIIYDRNLNQLVLNSPSFDLVCDRRDFAVSPYEGIKEIREVADIIGKDYEELRREIESSENPQILVYENLPHQTLIHLETKASDFHGCKIEKSTVREYAFNSLSHLMGYTGKINKTELENSTGYSISDYIGKSGLEKSYEEYLRGQPGKTQIEKDALGNNKSEKVLYSPKPGENLVLYLDAGLEKKLAEELEKNIKNVKASKGVAVAMDPKTGGILAMVSIPAYDNNLLSKGISFEEFAKIQNDPAKPFINRAISGGYAPGSTIKPLMATAALEEGIISPEKKLYCPLELCLFNKYSNQKECYGDWTFHGWTDLRRALAESVNPFFYMIGGGYTRPNSADSRLPQTFEGLGDSKIKKWLTLFDLGQKTGIDLPGEIEGRVPDSEWKKSYFEGAENQVWTIGDTYNYSIGQGYLSVTPLQIVTAFSALANGGKIFQPQLVSKIFDASNGLKKTTKEIPSELIRENFINPKNIEIVKEGMRDAVIYGSAVTLNDLPIKTAAKTGTAQAPKDGFYHHWVTVLAPYDDPQIVLTIMIENVEGLHSATLPVAKEVLNWYFSR